MGVTYFSIEFERDVYYPGQMVTGRVLLRLDKPKDIRGVEFKLCGQAKFHWTTSESYTDSEGKTQHRTITHSGKEQYICTKMALAGGKGNTFELPIGEYSYPFAVMLPGTVPSTYHGEYGGINFFGKVKLDIPWGVDKKEKRFFEVINLLNLNSFPNLQVPCKDEKSKTFCCWCCASGPLTIVAHIPRTGFAYHESIPITVEVDNASDVSLNKVEAKLYRKIVWRASSDTKTEKAKLKSLHFGELGEGESKTWSELMPLGPDRYPNLTGCNIITITYKLEIEADASGPHSDLELEIPITIGDIAFNETEPANPNQFPLAQSVSGNVGPPANVGFDPSAGVPNAGVGFVTPTAYPGTAVSYSNQQPGAAPYPNQQPGTTPYPGQQPAVAPYPGQQPAVAPYPGQQPAVAPYPGQQSAVAPYPGQQPGASPYPGQQPEATPYPGQQPGASPYPGAAPYPGQQPGAVPFSQQPGASPYPSLPPETAPYSAQPGVPAAYSSPAVESAMAPRAFAPEVPSAPGADLSLENDSLFKPTTIEMPKSNFVIDDRSSKDEKASQFTPLLPPNAPQG